MRVASLGFMNIIARVYIYIYIYILVGNLPCIEFVYRVLWAELQISCEFLLVETNIYLHTQRAQQNFAKRGF